MRATWTPKRRPVLDAWSATRDIGFMIQSFRHTGLEKFFDRDQSGVATLNFAKNAQEMNVPGWDLHPLRGTLEGHWSVKVNANWRMIFTFENENAILVDYRDYH